MSLLLFRPSTAPPSTDRNVDVSFAEMQTLAAGPAEDTFTRADSSTLGVTEVGGYEWIEDVGDWAIEGNRLTTSSGLGDAEIDLRITDYYVEIDLQATGWQLINVRYADAANFVSIGFQPSGNLIDVYTVVAGGVGLLSQTDAGARLGILRVEVYGDEFFVYLDGDLIVGETITDAALQTGTKVGVRTAGLAYFDGFKAGAFTGPSDQEAHASWAEMEVPNAPRRLDVSWSEMEIGDGARRGDVAWAEMEIGTAPRHADVSWAEAEVPEPAEGQHAEVSWAEMEAGDAPRRADVSWAEIVLQPGDGHEGWIVSRGTMGIPNTGKNRRRRHGGLGRRNQS